jgi:hypothetical protein
LIKNAFERWMNGINAHKSNTGLVRPQEFSVDATVEQLDKNQNTVKIYTLNSMWPSEMSAIDLSYDSSDQIEEFTVTFQYQNWVSDTTS